MKSCKKCYRFLNDSQFYSRKDEKNPNATYNQCIDCMQANSQKNYQANRTSRIEQQKHWNQNNTHLRKDYTKTYEATHRDQRAFMQKLYRETNPQKKSARAAVAYAVKTGRIRKPDRCNRCQTIGVVNGHHHDYSRPLDVEWLCVQCHMRHHHDVGD